LLQLSELLRLQVQPVARRRGLFLPLVVQLAQLAQLARLVQLALRV
jgi:hypothetical protein